MRNIGLEMYLSGSAIRSLHFLIFCEIIQTMQLRPFSTICQAIFLQYPQNTWNTNMTVRQGISWHNDINSLSLQTTTYIISGLRSCLYNNHNATNKTANQISIDQPWWKWYWLAVCIGAFHIASMNGWGKMFQHFIRHGNIQFRPNNLQV